VAISIGAPSVFDKIVPDKVCCAKRGILTKERKYTQLRRNFFIPLNVIKNQTNLSFCYKNCAKTPSLKNDILMKNSIKKREMERRFKWFLAG